MSNASHGHTVRNANNNWTGEDFFFRQEMFLIFLTGEQEDRKKNHHHPSCFSCSPVLKILKTLFTILPSKRI